MTKSVILYVCFVLIPVTVGGFAYYAGRQSYFSAKRSEFTFTLDALEKLRGDQVSEATSIIEGHCYSSAVILLQNPTAKNETVLKFLLPDLLRYRDHYSSEETQRSVTERRLEELIKNYYHGGKEAK